jgi:hypothetical protein
MKMRGSDLPSYRGKSNFWNLGGRSEWCSPVADLVPEVDVRSAERAAMALAFASEVACKVLTAETRVSTVVLRSP